ncbi:MAG: phosphodiester glycosidase family protein [Lachnospirales bacterium]
MKRKLLKTLITLGLVTLQTINIFAATPTTYSENVETTVLMEGLTYKEVQRATDLGFLDIYILEYDLSSETIDIDILRNNEEWEKRTALSGMITADTLAGVNASFFDTSVNYSDILGFEMEEGEVLYAKQGYNRTEAQANSLNLKKDGTLSFGYVSNQIKFATESGATVYVNSVNGLQDFENATIFTGNVISDTSSVDAKYDLYKIVVTEGRVTNVVPPKTSVTLKENEIALLTKDESLTEIFPVGTGVIYSVNTNLGDMLSNYELILSGGGTLLKDGAILKDGIQVSGSTRAPRTAVGITADNKLITMVVDGRGSSIGATADEMANLLLEQGVTDAIHLDGGGSSEIMTINHNNVNVIQNVPSDGTERKIANGLGFSSNVVDSYLTSIELVPKSENLFVGNSTSFTIVGYDQYGRKMYVEDTGGEFTITANVPSTENEVIANTDTFIGFDEFGNEIYMNEAGEEYTTPPTEITVPEETPEDTVTTTGVFNQNIFTPTTGGTGVVTVVYGGLEAQTVINVADIAKDITVTSNQSNIKPKEYTKLNGKVTSFDNNTTDFDLNLATVTLREPSMGYIKNGYFYSSGTEGVANIDVTYAGITKTISIKVKKAEVADLVTVAADTNAGYALNDMYSAYDDKYISYEEAEYLGLKEVMMVGKIEIDSMGAVPKAVKEIATLSQKSSFKIFSGGIATPSAMSFDNFNYYGNTFKTGDYTDLNTKIINLETFTSNSYNIKQVESLKNALDTNTMGNVIIQNSDPTFKYLTDTRFNTYLKEVLNEYVEETGNNVYLVNGNADGKNVKVDNLDNVTYIQLPVQEVSVDSTTTLTNDIYFYLDTNNVLRYSFKN